MPKPYLPARKAIFFCSRSAQCFRWVFTVLCFSGHSLLLVGFINIALVQDSYAVCFYCRHVCNQQLSIDINSLCIVLDWICSSLVVGSRIQKHSSVHGITLPSSWLLCMSPDDTIHDKQNLDLRSLVLEPIPRLLAQLNCASG